METTSLAAPAVRACIITLPMAVASDGPATTGIPTALAVH